MIYRPPRCSAIAFALRASGVPLPGVAGCALRHASHEGRAHFPNPLASSNAHELTTSHLQPRYHVMCTTHDLHLEAIAQWVSMGVGVSRGSLLRVSAWMLHSSAGRALNTKRSTLVLPARHVEAERGHERLDLNGKGALCRVAERLLRRLDRGFHVDRRRIQPHSAETAADHVDGL